MAIRFPGDPPLQEPSRQSSGAQGIGGAEKYGIVDGNEITVSNLNASNVSTGTLDANRIGANSITSSHIAANTITATEINVSQLSAISADLGTITAGSIDASLATITNIDADNIVTGTIYVGGAGNPDAIILQRDAGTTGTKLRWEGGTRIWSDNSNRLGLNSIGSPAYFYVNSTEKLVVPESGQVTIRGGVYSDGNLNVNNASLRLNGGDLIWYDYKLESGRDRFVFKDSGGAERLSLKPDGNNSQLRMNGYNLQLTSNKTAIVPTSRGYRSLYCMESPEVWFMDFVDELDDEDPIFDEVTTGEARVIELKGGGYQVWKKRKDHDGKRFETKTEEEFIKNEQFLRQAKV